MLCSDIIKEQNQNREYYPSTFQCSHYFTPGRNINPKVLVLRALNRHIKPDMFAQSSPGCGKARPWMRNRSDSHGACRHASHTGKEAFFMGFLSSHLLQVFKESSRVLPFSISYKTSFIKPFVSLSTS